MVAKLINVQDVPPAQDDTCAGEMDLDTITLERCRRDVDEMMLLTRGIQEDHPITAILPLKTTHYGEFHSLRRA
ncbi:MAG: hypothetical protein OEW59_02550 [Gammaproteobacteria bacterium]|nr:hypothetical protein [Gammaproteobacteria bacterium]